MSAKPLAAPLLMPVQCNPTCSDVTLYCNLVSSTFWCRLDLDLDLVPLDIDSDLDIVEQDPKTTLLMPVQCNPTFSDVTLHCALVALDLDLDLVSLDKDSDLGT